MAPVKDAKSSLKNTRKAMTVSTNSSVTYKTLTMMRIYPASDAVASNKSAALKTERLEHTMDNRLTITIWPSISSDSLLGGPPTMFIGLKTSSGGQLKHITPIQILPLKSDGTAHLEVDISNFPIVKFLDGKS